ncbi:MAG TPA: sigma-70 family RNA polymerase sigma factor [Ktedonobacterales bacterium]
MAQVWIGQPARTGHRLRDWASGWLAGLFALADAGAHAERGARHERGRAVSAAPPPSYDAFVHEHERAILNYLWRMTGDEQGAYDLTQEVFVRAWKRFAQVREYEDPRGWLFRVATNLALSAISRRRVKSEVALGELDPASSDPAGRLAERDQVRATLLQLNPQRRAALCLREVYGLSCAEVAKALGISGPAARMTLSRAREQFRDLYLREEGDRHDA